MGAQLCNCRTIYRQLGQLYVISPYKKKEEIEKHRENLLPDFEKVVPNPLIQPIPIQARAQPPNCEKIIEPLVEEDDGTKVVKEVEKELEEWAQL